MTQSHHFFRSLSFQHMIVTCHFKVVAFTNFTLSRHYHPSFSCVRLLRYLPALFFASGETLFHKSNLWKNVRDYLSLLICLESIATFAFAFSVPSQPLPPIVGGRLLTEATSSFLSPHISWIFTAEICLICCCLRGMAASKNHPTPPKGRKAAL